MFARSRESRRLVEWGSVSSVLSISGGGLLSSLFGGLLLRCEGASVLLLSGWSSSNVMVDCVKCF